jgi:hypothetical protein
MCRRIYRAGAYWCVCGAVLGAVSLPNMLHDAPPIATSAPIAQALSTGTANIDVVSNAVTDDAYVIQWPDRAARFADLTRRIIFDDALQ